MGKKRKKECSSAAGRKLTLEKHFKDIMFSPNAFKQQQNLFSQCGEKVINTHYRISYNTN